MILDLGQGGFPCWVFLKFPLIIHRRAMAFVHPSRWMSGGEFVDMRCSEALVWRGERLDDCPTNRPEIFGDVTTKGLNPGVERT